MVIFGNDRADKEAKKAATYGSRPLTQVVRKLLATNVVPWSKSAMRQEYHRKIKLAAIELWSSSPRFDRMAWTDPDLSHAKFTKLTSSISRNQARTVPTTMYPSSASTHTSTESKMQIRRYARVATSTTEQRWSHTHTTLLVCDAKPIPKWLGDKPCLRQLAGKLLLRLELLPYFFEFIRVGITGRSSLKLPRERKPCTQHQY